jgi:cell division initiation protein
MDLSPNDIRNCEFSTQMRGYSKDEVDSLLDQVATALDTVKQENLKLSMEVDSLKSQLSALRQFEDTIKSAAIDARRNADNTIADAKEEANLILSKARDEADRVVESHNEQLASLDSKIAAADLAKKSYLNKIHGVITSHLEIIDHLIKTESETKNDYEDQDSDVGFDSGKIEVTHSGELDRRQMETISSSPKSNEPGRIEEANAVDKIIEVSSDSGSEATASTDDDTGAYEVDPSRPVDPELAEALQMYQTRDNTTGDNCQTSTPSDAPMVPPQGHIIETNSKAEDIPPGFIVGPSADGNNTRSEDRSSTDRMKLDNHLSDEHNSVSSAKTLKPATPEALAEELDNVVAKFEEEMDKAAQS